MMRVSLLGYILIYLQQHIRAATYVVGAIIVAIWTLIRFFNSQTIYDLVTQQVLAHSWLHGYSGVAHLGTTNYLWKVILLYIPVDLLPGSPHFKLILVTIAVNIVTFILICIAIEKILTHFKLKTSHAGQVSMLWLAVVAGSVFWIQFANSRNIEVAAGLLFIALCLSYVPKIHAKSALGLIIFASLLFWADSLQLYMLTLPLLAYMIVMALAKKRSYKEPLYMGFVLLAGFVISLLITHTINSAFHIQIDQTKPSQHLSVSTLYAGTKNAVRSTARQLSGGIEGGTLREVINLGFLGLVVIIAVVQTRKKQLPLRLLLFIALFYLLNEIIYIASGAALAGNTSRYLITLGPITALLVAAVYSSDNRSRFAIAALGLFIGINVSILGLTLINTWDTSFSKDGHLHFVSRYLQNHNYLYAYGSMDTATPLAYYEPSLKTLFVPIACSGDKLVTADSFRDTHVINDTDSKTQIPIITDNGNIHNSPSVCTKANIINQLGAPISTDTIEDGSEVLVYRASVLRSLHE